LGCDIKRNIASNGGHLAVESEIVICSTCSSRGVHKKCMQNFGLETYLKMTLKSERM
jgi:hypothetical protein